MEAWKSHFIEKSARRSQRRSREAYGKGLVLILAFAALISSTLLLLSGYPK